MEREEVARHQRARLYGAMIESISERGYRSTTVAHVIGLAGVSRRAFYEQFSNKQDCFVATYDLVVARSRKRVLEAWGAERGWANRLHAGFKGFFEDVVSEPKGAHLVLVDSLGIGAKARERLSLASSSFERLASGAFRLSPDNRPLPAIASRAIVGGMRQVVFERVREQDVVDLRTLAEEFVDWVEAYRSPATVRLRAVATKRPPEVPPEAAAFLTGPERRPHLLGAVVHLTMDEGYSALSDHQIAQFASVSTEAFHKHFRSKEHCLLSVIEELTIEANAHVEARIAGATSWPQAVHAAAAAFVGYLVARPALLRVAFIDLFEVGPAMLEHMTRPVDRFVELVLAGAPEPLSAPEILPTMLVGAVWDIMSGYASSDRLSYLPCLIDHIAFVLLAPYIGAKEAIATIERCNPGSRRSGDCRAGRRRRAS